MRRWGVEVREGSAEGEWRVKDSECSVHFHQFLSETSEGLEFSRVTGVTDLQSEWMVHDGQCELRQRQQTSKHVWYPNHHVRRTYE